MHLGKSAKSVERKVPIVTMDADHDDLDAGYSVLLPFCSKKNADLYLALG